MSYSPSLLNLPSFHRNGCGSTGIRTLNVIISVVSHDESVSKVSGWNETCYKRREQVLIPLMLSQVLTSKYRNIILAKNLHVLRLKLHHTRKWLFSLLVLVPCTTITVRWAGVVVVSNGSAILYQVPGTVILYSFSYIFLRQY